MIQKTDLILNIYRQELCRICGKKVGNDPDPVYVGYSDNLESRTAHSQCWNDLGKTPDKWIG